MFICGGAMAAGLKKSALLLVWAALCAIPGWAQSGLPKYDPAAETTFQGSVEEVKTVAEGPAKGFLRLTVKTKTASADVLLAPASFLTEYEYSVAKGDQVEITGSKVKFESEEVVLVRQVTKGDNSLTVRDDKGGP